MLGAIVDFARQERALSMRRITAARIDLPMHDAYCLCFTLPCTQTAFLKKSAAARRYLLSRLERRLVKFGVGCVYAAAPLREYLCKKFFLPDGRRIFCAFAGQIIERHYRAFSFTPQTARVCVYAQKFDANALAAAQYMTRYTNRMCLVSADTSSAQDAAQALLDAYGLTASVTDSEKQLNRAEMVLLLSPPEMEICTPGLVLDFSGHYPYAARREVYFETAFGYAPLLDYFGRADSKSAEFMLCCYGLEREQDVCAALLSVGWKKT